MKTEFASIYIELSSVCDMNCPYCYNHTNKKYYLDIYQIQKLIVDAKKFGLTRVVLSGGEPFLYPNINELLDMSVLKDMDVMIITNGNFLTSDLMDKLIINHFKIQLTLDGSKAEIHGKTRSVNNFHKILHIIEYYKRKKKLDFINLRCNISMTNILDIHTFLDTVHKIGIRHCKLALVEPMGKGSDFVEKYGIYADEKILGLITSMSKYKQNYEDFYINLGDQSKCFGCPFLSKEKQIISLRVKYDGSIYPCQLIEGNDYIVDNIESVDLTSSAFLEKYSNVIAAIVRKFRYCQSPCKQCACANICQRGCLAIMIDGSKEMLHSSCIQKKFYIKEVLKRHGDIRLLHQYSFI